MYQYSTPPLLRTSGFPTSNEQLGLTKGGMTRVAHWPWSQVPVSCTASNINITPVVCQSCYWGDLQIGGKTRVFQLHYHFLKKSNMCLRSWRLHLVPCTTLWHDLHAVGAVGTWRWGPHRQQTPICPTCLVWFVDLVKTFNHVWVRASRGSQWYHISGLRCCMWPAGWN